MECTHQNPEYKLMEAGINYNPWIGLVCTDCGLVMEWVENILSPILKLAAENFGPRTTLLLN